MITMITMAPKLINMGCSSGVWGLKQGVPDPAEPGGLAGPGTALLTRLQGSAGSATS